MNKIYTYYDYVNDDHKATASVMLEHWRRSWSAQGWNPVILNKNHARSHPLYESFLNRILEYPTINPLEYEQACYLRWLAVAEQGGGFMSDYDVVNYSWRAREPTAKMLLYEVHADDELITPSVVGGTESGFQNVCAAICAAPIQNLGQILNDQHHVSDMLILQHYAATGLYAATRTVRQYGEDGWEHAPLVHYSHGSTAMTDRVNCMKTARSL